ncbi:7-deoxyloganetic acid glucosyl transferase [Eucalyptus grandis]|uniref:7-deoxyloganetic acid glucosyl transferase n=1 Tax=Eucalyptus grandis TaxID=71139 RepID=UPI00192EE200|nr:7-deoxyloganetic acid glucosyl transferase [Eucalyptus grandis]
MDPSAVAPPHVVIFPLAAQGHVNSMLKLAELLALSGLRITFINSEHIHHRLLQHADIQARFAAYPDFRFKIISDGFPIDHPRAGDHALTTFNYVKSITKQLLEELVSAPDRPVTCIIADGILSFTIDFAGDLGVPVIAFRTISASCFWTCFCIPRMIESGDLPIKGHRDMDRDVTSVPGMEDILRCRDLPSFCRVADLSDWLLQYVTTQTLQTTGARALILNSFDQLEGPALSQIRTHFPNLYTIGPLHSHLKSRLSSSSPSSPPSSSASNSLWEVDRSCIAWLDKQPPKSVVYVSFGSITTLNRHDFTEFWYGLVNSGRRFLWVLRSDSLPEGSSGAVPEELREAAAERGCIVGWAPQEEVLHHGAIAAFLTHSGWNSTLESVVAGKPMVCWPFFADQQLNSRLVSHAWKAGLDMKDVCDREVVERMVNEVMGERKEEFAAAAGDLARRARDAASEGGSSWDNLDRLIEDIRSMKPTS